MTPDVTAADAPTSKWFGSYLLLEALPAYGMVQPYVARADGRVGLCVVKRLLPALEGNPTARARFAREAKIGAQLQHPGIVPFVGHGVEGSTAFLAVDFLVGEPLQAALGALSRAGSRLPLPLFRTIAVSVLDALSFAHRARGADGTPLGIVHRDLTPRNIILTFAGEVKISDFGVARLNADDFKTVPGIAVGTLEYLSPEQATGQTVDARSDLYTLSALFYEMLAGQPVIPPGSTTVATLSLVANVEPTPLVTLRPDLSPRLAGVIERGMAKDREVRFQSAAEMKQALESALGPLPAAGPEVLSRFLRELLPDSEARMIQLMDRIRDQAATAPPRPSQIGADGMVRPGELERASPSQLATLVVRDRSTPRGGTPGEVISDEPPEPSVMTMPGTLVRGGEPAPLPLVSTVPGATFREPVPSRVGPPPRRWSMIAVVGVALLLVVAALLLRPETPEPVVVDDQAATSDPAPVVTAALKPGPPQAVAEPEPAPPAEASPPPRSEVLEAKGPPSKRRGVSKDPGESTSVSNPAPPAPPPSSPPPAESPYAGLRQKIRTMIAAQPKKDVRTFDEVRGALARLSKDLPEPTRQKVASKLSSADLAQDVEELGQALELIERSRAQLE